MNCSSFESALEQATETREPLSAQAAAHAQSCTACGQRMLRSQLLDDVIAAWRLTTPPRGLVDSVLAKLAEPAAEIAGSFNDAEEFDTVATHASTMSASNWESSVPARKTTTKSARSSFFAVATIAACLMIAIVTSMRSPQSAFSPETQLAKVSSPVTETRLDSPFDVPGALSTVLASLQSEYRGIASETTSAANEIVASIPDRDSELLDVDQPEMFPAADEVTRALNPIGSRVGSALGFLLQTIPSEVPAG